MHGLSLVRFHQPLARETDAHLGFAPDVQGGGGAKSEVRPV